MGATLAEDSFDRTQLDFEKAIVTFSKGSGYYAFDTWEPYYDKISLIESKYEKLHQDYYVPWKLLVSGKTDVVSAAIRINDPIIDADKVEFKTPKGVTLTASRNGNVYTIQLVDGPAGDVQELYALYPKGDGKYWNLGKLSIATYAPQRHDVVLVSVEGTVIDSGIEAKLKEVYGPVGVTFNVLRDTMAYDTEQLMKQSTGLRTYNEAMRTLNNTYRARRTPFNRKANYLFFLKATGNVDINNRDFTGFMPRGGQFGYIFTSEIKDINEPVTVAHELGHGRFKLYHTFDKHYGGYEQGNTTNIMDYSNKTHFAKWQWDQVHDPAMVVSLFEGDEKSEMGILHTYCIPDKNLAYKWNQPNEIKTYLTPSGNPIRFSASAPLSNLLFGGFTCEGKTSSEIPSASQQTLSGFTLDGFNYVAVIDISNIPFIGATKFLGYALIPNNTTFDSDKFDSYTYYNFGTTSWESSVTVSIPVEDQHFEECSVSISKIDFTDRSLMKELPCPYLSIDIDIFKLKKNNLEALNQNLFIQVLGKVEHSWQSGRRYYLNEESQTANNYWITQLWNEIYGPYYLVDNLGQIEINSYKIDPQKAFVQPTISLARAAKNLKTIGDAVRGLILLGAVINADFKIDDGVSDANALKVQASGYNEVEKLQLIAKVVQLRKDVIDALGNQTLNPEVLRELVHLLHHINEALKKVFGNDSTFPFHITDYEKLQIEPLPVRTIIPKVDPNATEPVIIADPTLEDIEKYVRYPDFDPVRYTRPQQDEEENYNVYVSIREIKYLEKATSVTQPLFYVGITTEEDPIERYKNEQQVN